jgi:hypothetical protein
MVILNKGQQNELTLNINNNSRQTFTGYTLTFVHALSQEVKSYVIDTSDISEYGQNDRFCEIILNLQNDDLNYEGQYQLQIFGNGTSLVYTILCDVVDTNQSDTFVSYQSNNEDNENYIYIQD